jgi:allantoinase
MSFTLTLKSQRVVFPDGERPASLTLMGGRIVAINGYDAKPDGEVVDVASKAILPGLIDTHVHFNEPGRTEWEGWRTGTAAALAGGVTTVVEMPLNSIPSTVDLASLWVKRVSTTDQLYCDVGLWGGAVPGNAEHLRALVGGGALGLKAFMSDPGTAEFRHLDRDGLRLAMQEIAAIDSVLLLHAEWPDALVSPDANVDPHTYQAWLDTRPVAAEREAIKVVVELSQQTGCRCHIVHVASHEVLDLLEGTGVTCETCAHYLAFAAEDIPDRATNFKCAPPIRQAHHREGLWQGLSEGKIQMVTSDHSPCTPDLKNESFLASWGGIAGVQMLLPVTWTGAFARGFSLPDVARWLAEEPAKLAGLAHDRGSIKVGNLAHLVVFDADAVGVAEQLIHRHAGSPYEGRPWKGVVEATYLHGELAFDGTSVLPQPRGRLVLSGSESAVGRPSA